MATYYVDATSGDDGANGTSDSTPWKTIAKVNAASFSAGDSILFKKGETWREQLTVPSSGNAGNPITFGAYGSGNKPIINGSEIVTGWTQSIENKSQTFYPTESADDCRFYSNPGIQLTEATLRIGGTIDNDSAIRFRSVTVPKDATIVSSYLTITSLADYSNAQNTTIYGELNSAPAVFSTYANATGRGLTTANVAWNLTSSWSTDTAYNSSDISTIISEITTLAGWSSGNNLALFIISDHSDDDQRAFYSYDNGSKIPSLTIVYEGTATTIWEAACTTEPNVVIFDGVLGTPKTSIVNLTSARDWFWNSNKLYTYSATDPDSAYTTVESGKRDYGIWVNKLYVTIDGLNIKNVNLYAVTLLGNGNVIKNCTISNFDMGIYVSGNSNLLSTNTISYGYENGLFIVNGNDNIIEYNDIRNIYDFKIFPSAAGSGIKIYKDPDPSNRAIVRFNYLKNNAIGIYCAYELDTQIYCNLIVESYIDAILRAYGTAANPVLIYNNTIIHSPNNTIGGGGGVGHGISNELDGDGSDIRNNIIYITHTGTATNIAGICVEDDYAGITINNNLVYKIGSATGNLYRTAATFYTTLGDWQTAIAGYSFTGKSANDINSDPLFVDAINGNFRLQVESPCRNAGVDVSITTDYAGNVVPKGALPDIGAYEWFVPIVSHDMQVLDNMQH